VVGIMKMKKILVGIDNSPRTPAVLAAATELAERMRAKLILFRAVTIPTDPNPGDYTTKPAEYGGLLEERARHELLATAATIDPELLLRVRVELGIPWDAICRAAQSDDVDCIVIGSHGYGALDRLLGTTAAKVVNHADRSVMVVRAVERLAA
jgi:nucleotide-binding universal stress UspA family protein